MKHLFHYFLFLVLFTAPAYAKNEALTSYPVQVKYDCLNKIYYLQAQVINPGSGTVLWEVKPQFGSWQTVSPANYTYRQDMTIPFAKYRFAFVFYGTGPSYSDEFDYIIPPSDVTISLLAGESDCAYKSRVISSIVMGGKTPRTLQWAYNADEVANTPSSLTGSSLEIYPKVSTSVTLTVIDGNGCYTSETKSIPVNSGGIFISGNTSVCAGTTEQYTSTGGSGYSYTRSLVTPDGSASGFKIIGSTSPYVATFNSNFSSMYLVSKASNGLCGYLNIGVNTTCRSGVEEDPSSDLFPNPTHDHSTLLIKGKQGTSYHANLYSSEGKLVQTLSNLEKNVPYIIGDSLPKGIYILKIVDESGISQKRFVITD